MRGMMLSALALLTFLSLPRAPSAQAFSTASSTCLVAGYDHYDWDRDDYRRRDRDDWHHWKHHRHHRHHRDDDDYWRYRDRSWH
jgi:hypothetical protein